MLVILFDGMCNVCNASVNWMIDHDKKNQFFYSSLQSEYGKRVVEKFNIHGDYMDTMILLDGEKAFLRSDAVLQSAKHLGGIYSLGYAFIVVPRFIRDFIYNFVARNRYRWFGKRDSCRIPTPDIKSKFLEA